jgi:photosystem II stability/assembly factor-like uncharacterized protein
MAALARQWLTGDPGLLLVSTNAGTLWTGDLVEEDEG